MNRRSLLRRVAATLAAALTAYEAKAADGSRLIDEPVLNSVIVLLVVTSVLGPVLTEVFGRRLATQNGRKELAPAQQYANLA